MMSTTAIFIKDLRSYFSSFIGYFVAFVFLVISGYFFFSLMSFFSLVSFQTMQNPYMQQGTLNLTEAIVTPLVMNVSVVMLFMLPILTMRSFAEEKKHATSELLFTYPIKNSAIVIGKYAALCAVFFIMLAPLFVYPVLVSLVGGVFEMGTFSTGMLGLLLLGMSFISLGMFASSLTENQIVAVSLSFGALLIFWIIGWAAEFAPPQLASFLMSISLIEHFKNCARGLIDTQDILFYGLFISFFFYLTLRVLESRNWRG